MWKFNGVVDTPQWKVRDGWYQVARRGCPNLREGFLLSRNTKLYRQRITAARRRSGKGYPLSSAIFRLTWNHGYSWYKVIRKIFYRGYRFILRTCETFYSIRWKKGVRNVTDCGIRESHVSRELQNLDWVWRFMKIICIFERERWAFALLFSSSLSRKFRAMWRVSARSRGTILITGRKRLLENEDYLCVGDNFSYK